MSYADIRKRAQEAAQPAAPRFNCVASNCPCRGTISFDGGRWVCSAHAFSIPDQWPRITEKLNDHRWLIEFIDQIQAMNRAMEDWRAFSEQFWANQDEVCVPDEREEAVPYQNRMRGELLYRCGLSKRPGVRLPKQPTSRGNAADGWRKTA